MSVEDLRARLANLDTEIILQKELLRKLERDKCLVQWKLNAALDPIARLPLEISSDIFLQSRAGARHISMLLLTVCHAWKDIALSTPALWANIHIIFPCAEGFKDVLPIWLARAHNYPLSVWLEGAFDKEIVSIIWEHGRQLQHLEISKVKGLSDNGLWGGGTCPGPLPLLSTLAIRGAKDSEGMHRSDVFELLRLAPNLVECLICNARLHNLGLHNFDHTEILVLPKLRRLVFEQHGTSRPDVGAALLNCVSLPKLEALTGNASSITLLSFLKRSSPPLRELVFGHDIDIPSLAEFVPDLRTFEAWSPRSHRVEESFALLAESPSLLPHLSTVIIHLLEGDVHASVMSQSFWTAAARALAARRGQLQALQFSVRYRPPPSMMPTPDIAAAFGELAIHGTRVCINATHETWSHVFV